MTNMTMQLSDDLAERLQPVRAWLPTIIELSLSGFRTVAVEAATELVDFLKTEPTPNAVLSYHTTERAQQRLQRLFALNQAGMLSMNEQRELDELGTIEHIVTELKMKAATQLKGKN